MLGKIKPDFTHPYYLNFGFRDVLRSSAKFIQN